MPSSRAISAIGRPEMRTNSTASRLNSGVNSRLALRCFSFMGTASSHRRCPASGGKSMAPLGVPAADVLAGDTQFTGDLGLGAAGGEQLAGLHADVFERLAVAQTAGVASVG